jgi:hypothetical protein
MDWLTPTAFAASQMDYPFPLDGGKGKGIEGAFAPPGRYFQSRVRG